MIRLFGRVLTLSSVLFTFMIVPIVGAQAPEPVQVAEKARSELVAVQLANDPSVAATHLVTAQKSLVLLASQLEPLAPEQALTLKEAARVIQLESSPRFAAARAQIWIHIVGGGLHATLAAIARGDQNAAQRWLQVRAFRTATRVTRASVEATKALEGWRTGSITAGQASAAVQHDLLDTYTAQTRDGLTRTADSASRHSQATAAEQARLAAGYFGLVSDIYQQQRGADQAAQLRAQFGQFANAAVEGNWSALETLQPQLLDALRGFTVTPLSEDEIRRKSTQLLQFINLLQIEYAKGVRNGAVTVPKEVHEAQTFQIQSSALLDELEPVFLARDDQATQQLRTNLGQLGDLLKATAAPTEVSSVARASMALLTDTLGTSDMGGDLAAVSALLAQLQQEVQNGKYDQAELLRLQAYAIFEVGPEPKLFARDQTLGDELQAMFWQGIPAHPGLADVLARKAPASEIQTELAFMETQIQQADATLNSSGTPLGAITAAIAILIREGLEAVLVLAAIVGYLKATKAPKYATQQILAGAGLAIGASFAVWGLARTVLSITTANRELVSGVIALIAAVVLASVTNWLLHKAYVVDWVAFVKQQVDQALGRSSIFGLALLGFMIVFREGFETVLFFEALSADAPPWAIAVGAIIGLLIIGVIAALVLRYSVRLPLKPFFTVTSVLLIILAISFVGNGVRNFQEAGLVSVTRLDSIPIGLIPSLFGLYPTYETILAQIGLLIVLAGTFMIARLRAAKKSTVATATSRS